VREYRIAAIPGDGIGAGVIAAGLEALEVVADRDGGFRLGVEHLPWGSDFHLAHGRLLDHLGEPAAAARAVRDRIRDGSSSPSPRSLGEGRGEGI
jgi:isocitrate/isopropylmalate dehydrogenase